MQQMVINRNSWHYKYNVYFYGLRNTEDLKSGCPYFWKTVLACLLAPLAGIVEIAERIHDNFPELPEVHMPKISEQASDRILKGMAIFVLCIIAFATAYAVYLGFWLQVLIVYGAIGAVIGMIVGLCYLVSWIVDWHESRPRKYREPKVKNPNMMVQMIKAKKNKYCPKLEFTN